MRTTTTLTLMLLMGIGIHFAFSLEQIGSIEGVCYDIQLDDDILWCIGESTFSAIDVSTPEYPFLINDIFITIDDCHFDTHNLEVTTGIAYVNYLGYLRIIDISDMDSFNILCESDINHITDLALNYSSHDYLYLISNYFLFALDVSNPSLPTIIDGPYPPGYATDCISMYNDYLLASSGLGYSVPSFVVIDVTEPYHFCLLSETGEYFINSLYAWQDTAVSAGSDGLVFFDISDLEYPIEFRNINSEIARQGFPRGLYYHNGFLYVVKSSMSGIYKGLSIFCICSSPDCDYPIYLDSTRSAYSVTGNDSFLFIGWEDSLRVYVIDTTSGIKDSHVLDEFEISIFPNPFNSSIRLQVSDFREQEIEIFDLLGKRIANFGLRNADNTDNRLPITANREYIWQPDESIASGVYLIKAITKNGNCTSKRIVYIR